MELPGRCGGMTLNKAGNKAEIRRPHFALLGFEVAATPKLVRSIKAKQERIMVLLGELEEILEK